jgi:hypothetical protein
VLICIVAFIVSLSTFAIPPLQIPITHQMSAAAQPIVNPANPGMSTTTSNNTKLDCSALGKTIGGIPVPNGNVCDVVVVRKSPQIMGHNGLLMNQFTLMNSVLEFLPMAASMTNASTTTTSSTSNQSVYVMGDFALLESEMNPVLQTIKQAGWTVTGVHNHMILESPKTSFMHWETQGNLNTIIGQIKDALAKTSIQRA